MPRWTLRTFTVMGQVLDADGNGVRGVQVINHAGRSVSQEDGFFTLELSARAPVVGCVTSTWSAAR